MTKLALVLILLLDVRVHAQSAIQGPTCDGVIRGAVFDRSGQRATGITVVGWPLGVDLGAMLPRVMTDQAGDYRFEHVCRGRYTVIVEDKKAGYPYASPLMNEFLYGVRAAVVKVTAKHPQVELRVNMPPKPGLMQIHVSDGEKKTAVLQFTVKLSVPRQRRTHFLAIEFKQDVRNDEIQVPPDKNVICHVTAEGFREWRESAGTGKTMLVPSGTHVALEVSLDPLN